MQSRYCEINDVVKIPLTNNRFTISMNGDVFDEMLKKKVMVQHLSTGEAIVDLQNSDLWRNTKMGVLLAIISKRIKIPYNHWKLLDVLYIDGNVKNFHPSNTVWKFPAGGLNVNEESDFCFIPGFSRYSINKSGIIFSHLVNKFLSPYQDEMGYWMYGLTPDVGKRTIMGMHRALALAFLPYPPEVNQLDVNHLDGIKTNNTLTNLEWAKRKRNCEHAYSSGLRTDNIEVCVRNSFTGEVRSYYSLEECARQLNMDGETIRLRIKSNGQKIYPPGYQFKASKDNSTWKEILDPLTEMRNTGLPIPLRVTNLQTMEVHNFSNGSELATLLKISSSGVSWHLRKNDEVKIIKNHLIEYRTLASNN